MPQLLTTVRVADQVLLAKLAMAQPRIIATNRAMTYAVMELAKAGTMAATPIGPGHFGYHGRDTLRIEVDQKGIRTVGKLKGAIQLYWREYGTMGHFRKSVLLTKGRGRRARLLETWGGAGERSFYTAHKSLAGFKAIVKFYYGSVALWWRA